MQSITEHTQESLSLCDIFSLFSFSREKHPAGACECSFDDLGFSRRLSRITLVPSFHLTRCCLLLLFGLTAACSDRESTAPVLAATTPASELADALAQGNAATAARLLQAAPELLATPLDDFGNLPLQVAVRAASLTCVQAVLAAGAPADVGVGPQKASASFAVFDAHPPQTEILQALLDAGASPTLSLPDGSTLLLAACRNGQTPVTAVGALLAAGADPREPGAEGLTPLHWAVINDRADLAASLLRAGVDPEDREHLAYGWTPLDMAFLGLDEEAEGLNPAQYSFAHTHQLLGRGESPLLEQLTTPPTPTALLPVLSVVEAWLQAVQAGDRAAADALGTEAFRTRERDWKPSFSNAFFGDSGTTLQSYEIGIFNSLESGGKGGAEVNVRATLRRADGSADGEGLRFQLKRSADGTWLITELR